MEQERDGPQADPRLGCIVGQDGEAGCGERKDHSARDRQHRGDLHRSHDHLDLGRSLFPVHEGDDDLEGHECDQGEYEHAFTEERGQDDAGDRQAIRRSADPRAVQVLRLVHREIVIGMESDGERQQECSHAGDVPYDDEQVERRLSPEREDRDSESQKDEEHPEKAGRPVLRTREPEEEPDRHPEQSRNNQDDDPERESPRRHRDLQSLGSVVPQDVVLKGFPGLPEPHQPVGLLRRFERLAVDPHDEVADLHAGAVRRAARVHGGHIGAMGEDLDMKRVEVAGSRSRLESHIGGEPVERDIEAVTGDRLNHSPVIQPRAHVDVADADDDVSRKEGRGDPISGRGGDLDRVERIHAGRNGREEVLVRGNAAVPVEGDAGEDHQGSGGRQEKCPEQPGRDAQEGHRLELAGVPKG